MNRRFDVHWKGAVAMGAYSLPSKAAYHDLLVIAFLLVIVFGCEANRYELKLVPTGETLRRELTCWRENSSGNVTSITNDELNKISAAYDAAIVRGNAGKHNFAAEFIGQMPDDIGGSGSHTHWTTPMGSLSVYVERVRGDDDLATELEARQRAVNRIVDLLVQWLSTELDSEAGFEQLRTFMAQTFRRDLWNLSLYGWVSETAPGRQNETSMQACLVRVGQYLVERDYFTLEQLPMLIRVTRESMNEPSRELPSVFYATIQRFLASKMGLAIDEPIPKRLKFLSDVAALESSLNTYLRETAEYKKLIVEWQRAKKSDTAAEPPKPIEVFGRLMSGAFLRNWSFDRSDQLNVKLDVAVKPFWTNGQWDQATQEVRWSANIAAVDSGRHDYPTVLYAVWTIPDKAKQRAHFGKIVLDGDTLGIYCLWYYGLLPDEVIEWNEFVDGLTAKDKLKKRLSAFRFSGEGQDGSQDTAATPRRLILQQLTE